MLRLLAAFLLLSSPALAEMTLEMPGLVEGRFTEDQAQMGTGCGGMNLSPELLWSGAPAKTQSFVLTAYDPDAPTGSGFWHWSVFDIPADVTHFDEAASSGGALPPGTVQARNDLSNTQYDGACPPEGSTHRYVFTIYAMPQKTLGLDAGASGAMVGYFANTGSLARASVTVSYGR